MAQIEQSDKGKAKKGAQKKKTIHVDFTPMVDMNMLLITFFMLCTTMLKSQTLKIALPTNEKSDKVENSSQAGDSQAITMLLDTERNADGSVKENVIYYYEGKAPIDSVTGKVIPGKVKTFAFLDNTADAARNVRLALNQRNRELYDEIQELKRKYRAQEFDKTNKTRNQELFDEAVSEAHRVFNEKEENGVRKFPIVMIKATGRASWESVISALDEMYINEIDHYQIDNLNKADSVLLMDLNIESLKTKVVQKGS